MTHWTYGGYDGRVGMWRSAGRSSISVAASFVWRCLSGWAMGSVSTIPLIEPDVRISRIRLSDKLSCLRPRQVARQPGQADQPQRCVEVSIRVAFDPFALRPVLSA